MKTAAKKIVLILLSLSIVMLAMAGCGGKAGSDDSTPEGWWVRPEGYKSGGLSLIDAFYVDGDSGELTVYSSLGEAGSTLTCTFDDNTLTIDFGFDEVSFTLKGEKLINPENDEVEFVRVEKPDFEKQDISFDGKWYRAGQEDIYYEISGKDYKKVVDDEGTTEREGVYKLEKVKHSLDGYEVPDVLQLSLGDREPDLVVSSDGSYLFEEHGTKYELYVRESQLSDEMAQSYFMVNGMLDMDLTAHDDEGNARMFRFYPYCFSITDYVRDGDGLTQQGTPLYGTWKIAEAGKILLVFADDGAEETVTIPEEEGTLHVDAVDADFELEPIF